MALHLQRDLDNLQRDLLSLAGLVEEAIYKSTRSLQIRDAALAREVIAGVARTCEEAIAPAVTASMHYSPIAVLSGWRGPILSVISEMNALPYSLHRLLPEIPAEVLRHAGHWLMMDRPGPFNEILERFADAL